jgi:small subunit ribosomal protein S6
MKSYESLIIIKPNLSEDDVNKLIESIQGWITNTEGEILLSKPWGVRELAYPIDKFTQGYYYQVQFKATNKTLDELHNRFRVTELFIRELTVTLDSIYSKNQEQKVEEVIAVQE